MSDSYHPYDAMVSTMAEKFYTEGDTLIFNFDQKARIDIKNCNTENAVIETEKKILELCNKNKSRLPDRYLISTFIYELAHKYGMDPKKLMRKFDAEVGWAHAE